MAKDKKHSPLQIVNKKAKHLYELMDFIEAGIVLTGPEVKSIRAGKVNFIDSYVEFKQGEAWLISLHIAPYANSGHVINEPDRNRKLLLHANEISKFNAQIQQKGLTVIPVSIYFKHGKIKVELALGRGKKLHDHRDSLKKKAEERDAARELM